MDTYFDRAFTQMPELRPRNKVEQRIVWKNRLREEQELEKMVIQIQELEAKLLGIELSLFIRLPEREIGDAVKKIMTGRAQGLDLLFHQMHRVAYFEDLLQIKLDEKLQYECD